MEPIGDSEAVELHVIGLDGNCLDFRLSAATTGLEVARMIKAMLPEKKGARILLHGHDLHMTKTWHAQGLPADATLTSVFVPATVNAAWSFLKGYPVYEEELALQGVTKLSGIQFEDELGDLPETLESLEFHSSYNTMTSGIAFPKSLKNMTFGHRFDQSLTGFTFPIALESLTFGPSFNQSLQNAALPGKLQVLTFGQDFNQSLEGVCFPSSLQSLTFGYCFDQSLDGVQLPHGLKSLIFGDCFDQSLEQVDLPSGLEELTLGEGFGLNESSALGILPTHLQELTCNSRFVDSDVLERLHLLKLQERLTDLHSLTFQAQTDREAVQLPKLKLPSSLQRLSFADGINHLKRMCPPTDLQVLTLGDTLGDAGPLPETLKILSFGKHFDESLLQINLPRHLKTLNFGDKFNQNLNEVHLPSFLESLTFGNNFNQSLDLVTFPQLLSLTFGERFNQSLEHVALPRTLRSLKFGYEYDQPLEHVKWPDALEELKFGHLFRQPLDFVTLPPHLQTLKLGGRFNDTVDKVVFPSLRSLTFGEFFNQSLEQVTLPQSLEELTFGTHFNHSLDKVKLPVNLQSLTLGRAFNQTLQLKWPKLTKLTLQGSLEYNGLQDVELPDTLRELCCAGLLVSAAQPLSQAE